MSLKTSVCAKWMFATTVRTLRRDGGTTTDGATCGVTCQCGPQAPTLPASWPLLGHWAVALLGLRPKGPQRKLGRTKFAFMNTIPSSSVVSPSVGFRECSAQEIRACVPPDGTEPYGRCSQRQHRRGPAMVACSTFYSSHHLLQDANDDVVDPAASWVQPKRCLRVSFRSLPVSEPRRWVLCLLSMFPLSRSWHLCFACLIHCPGGVFLCVHEPPAYSSLPVTKNS